MGTGYWGPYFSAILPLLHEIHFLNEEVSELERGESCGFFFYFVFFVCLFLFLRKNSHGWRELERKHVCLYNCSPSLCLALPNAGCRRELGVKLSSY